MKKILVPTDFSELAGYAVEVAYNIAKTCGTELVLLHVVEAPTSSSFSVDGEAKGPSFADNLYTIEMVKRARNQIQELIGNPDFQDVEMFGDIKIGNAYHGIKSIVADLDVDLVVMGTSGASGLEEILVGSTTEKVVRYAKCPVLSIHKKQEQFKYKDIVFATSSNDQESGIVDVIKLIQKTYGSTIHVLRVNTPNSFQRDKKTLQDMEEMIKRYGLENYTINIYNDVTEEEGIIYFSESKHADLIALATHGRTGLAHLISGSIAEDVVNHANRPVLTYVTQK